MKKQSIALAVLILIITMPLALAEKHSHKSKKRHHDTHEHGLAKFDLSFEGAVGVVGFESETDSLYGFEHEPKTEAEKAKVLSVKEDLKNNFKNYASWPENLGCEYSLKKSEDHHDSHNEHNDLDLEFDLKCQKPIEKTTLSLNFASK